MNIGITGQSGFIGYHLKIFLQSKGKDLNIIEFNRDFFSSKSKIDKLVKECDVIIHLAAMNRGEPAKIYKNNMRLVEILVDSLKRTKSRPHIIFASSTQEKYNNAYGKSKRDGRIVFYKWAQQYNSCFSGLIIPNVFGPFAKPNYNSVVATFSYNINNGKENKIIEDKKIEFIYVYQLADYIYKILSTRKCGKRIIVPFQKRIKVSTLLKKIKYYRSEYLKKNLIPRLKDSFDYDLFNTFRSYLRKDFFPRYLDIHSDNRGKLFEVLRSNIQSQVFISTTKPGMERGNHYHLHKIERFCVISGKAEISLRKIEENNTIIYRIDKNIPAIIDIPILYTHKLKNIGNSDLIMLFWTNKFYNPEDTDTYYEKV